MKQDLFVSKISKAKWFLAQVNTILQVKEVIAMAEAAAVYGKRIGATLELQNSAAEIRLRAERRLGEMLIDAPKQAGARGKRGGGTRGSKKELQVNAPPTLESAGITKKESSRSQELAAVPEAEFEALVIVEPGCELNHNRVIKLVKEKRQRGDRKKKRNQAAAGTKLDDRIIVGDFRQHSDKVADGSLSLIFTDPPYDREASKMLPKLAEFAATKLAEGGSLICYVGQTQLPAALDALRLHLRYWWTIACVHAGRSTVMREYGINAGWKAVLWFVKGTRDDNSIMVNDVMSGGEEKEHHDWQQSQSEAEYWIEKLCPQDGIVCDPFLGGGTTGAAAEKLNRQWIGFEIDPDTAKTASKRVAK
jgi:16S rRNA G966 N2-methylase RsmD